MNFPVVLHGFEPFPVRGLEVSIEIPEIRIDLPQFTVAAIEDNSVEAE